MPKNLFGKSINFYWYPQADDEDTSAYELVTARIYSDLPTEGQKEGTDSGHIESVTSWTATSENEYLISFAAITDSEPHDAADYETYYVVVRYRYQSSGPIVFDTEVLYLYRPDSATSRIEVTAQDVYDLEPRIELLAKNELWTEAKIEAAVEDLIARIEAKGLKKRRAFNWQKLNAAAKRLACAYACNALAGEGNQFWAEKGAAWERKANIMYESANLGYDLDGSDTPGPEEKVFSGAVALVR